VITKDLVIGKDFCTYSTIFLRQEKILRDQIMGGTADRRA
jgi:hypothetical protein